MTDGQAAPWELMRRLDGYLTAQLLFVAAELGLAELLTERPRTADELAAAAGVAAGPLRRIVRGLVVEEILAEGADGLLTLTPLGDALRPVGAAPCSYAGRLDYDATAGLLAARARGRGPIRQRV